MRTSRWWSSALIIGASLLASIAPRGAPLAAPARLGPAAVHDLPEILASGQLRHLGIPYANFVTGSGDGLDVDLVRAFCVDLGVSYVFVETDWSHTYTDLTGRTFERNGQSVEFTGYEAVRGDMIAHGMTVLPWREELVNFAPPMFPTQIWLIAPSESPLSPIEPTGSLSADIERTFRLLSGSSVLSMPNTCLDQRLYDLAGRGAEVIEYEGSLNHMAPNLLGGMANLTILDVPDALVALRRWQGKIKILGPISQPQHMSTAFRKDSPELQAAFEDFLSKIWADGTYVALVEKYYPGVREYYPNFFSLEVASQ